MLSYEWVLLWGWSNVNNKHAAVNTSPSILWYTVQCWKLCTNKLSVKIFQRFCSFLNTGLVTIVFGQSNSDDALCFTFTSLKVEYLLLSWKNCKCAFSGLVWTQIWLRYLVKKKTVKASGLQSAVNHHSGNLQPMYITIYIQSITEFCNHSNHSWNL